MLYSILTHLVAYIVGNVAMFAWIWFITARNDAIYDSKWEDRNI